MVTTKRSKDNPLFFPTHDNSWEAEAAFNGSVVKDGPTYTMVYRALSVEHLYLDKRLKLSTIGCAESRDGVHFRKRRQLIVPTEPWEKYGCEDPRITKFEGKYYIFYTAIGNWPPNADGIKVAVAVTSDLTTIEERHLVTPFNAKAMGLFPQRINGKIGVVVTANTDRPPAKICIALLDAIEQLWDPEWWNEWYKHIDSHLIPIYHTESDHLEVGAAPVKTMDGWILVFCYIENYFNAGSRIFRIDAALLDLNNPQKLVGQTLDPLLVPEEQYEIYGMVPNVIFPSGALLDEGQFFVYYSSCDTSVCRASVTLNDLLEELKHNPTVNPHHKRPEMMARFEKNPILSPITSHSWESKYTFNAGAIYVGNRIHILYRAMGDDDTSVLGYASSEDGLHIDERLDHPVYVPREGFEWKHQPGFSGCEDPRLTRIDDTIYMCYTAYDGINPPRIALTSIKADDLVKNNWNWARPRLISAPGMDNKDSCIMPGKIDNKYVVFHRLPPCIWIDFVSDLEFDDNHWLGGHQLMGPRVNSWDNLKIGLNGPPEHTPDGWLLLYHGVSREDMKYRMGAALLDIDNPMKVLARLHNPILEPLTSYENEGYRAGTVFSCGQVIKDGVLFIYYGGADKYEAVATTPLENILNALKKGK
jgi:beta-1,2-mannobiose phosphorylase / 1,2-beta-oligomannan phosphorylase